MCNQNCNQGRSCACRPDAPAHSAFELIIFAVAMTAMLMLLVWIGR